MCISSKKKNYLQDSHTSKFCVVLFLVFFEPFHFAFMSECVFNYKTNAFGNRVCVGCVWCEVAVT